MAQGAVSVCAGGVALMVGVSDTQLQCIWRVGRRNGASVGNARLRAGMLCAEEVVCNEYIVDGKRDQKHVYTVSWRRRFEHFVSSGAN